MKIAFIFPPFDHKKFEEDIDIVSREFTQPPPLGLAYAAAIAEQHGHEVIIIDANTKPRITREEAVGQIMNFGAQMAGFMLTVYMFRQTLEWIKFIKQKTGLPVLTGNVLLDLYPDEVMSHPEIDYGIIGPATKSLPALLYNLERGRNLDNIGGLAFKDGGKVCINPPSTLEEDFGSLPFPARHLLSNEKYHTIVSKRKNFTIMITSKGCPSRCGFCYVKNIPYSFRTAEKTADEIEECYKKYGIREIEFFDPLFTFNKQRVIDISRQIKTRNLDIIWACRSRVDTMDEELLNEMKSGGCKRIYYGIESGCQEILNASRKGITLDRIKRIVDLTKDKGILVLGFFLIGAPGDTMETASNTIDFALSLNLDYAQFHKTIAKPGTILYDQVKEATGRDYWREYILGLAQEERLPSPWTSLSEKDIEALTVKAYRRFYFRPLRLGKIILGINSFDEFSRYMRSGLGMLNVHSDL
ncbi:MAG: radical SAM protein [Candidatus Omnitrophica bacterium]|nr:radical SAM protein [Candidatus Omnitrophota bacterium]